MPQREADLYPLAQTREAITVAIDEIKQAARAERYFGADLIEEGILPVSVVVSNYGSHRLAVKPSDVLLYRGREIIDPLPVETVVATAKRQHWRLSSKTAEQLDTLFESMTFRETQVLPNESYQGVLFFPLPISKKAANDYLAVRSLYREGGPRVRVGVTDVDAGGRLHFGPFTVSLPENVPRY
jgi:hypothetical protein